MSQNINIRLSSNVVQLSPGEGTVLAVTVINNGRGVERLELSVGNIDPGWLLFDQNELLLYPDAPGNEGTVNLQISLPPTALPGSYSPTIEIRNAGDQVADTTAQLVLIVNQLAAVVGSDFRLLQESVQTKHKWARFQLQMSSSLDLPQTLRLYGRPNIPSTRLRIIPPVIELPPHGQAMSVIEVEPAKRNRIRPGKRYDFVVGADNSPGQVNGFMVQTASMSFLARILATPWLLTLSIILPLLIVGGVIAFILWPRKEATQNVAQQTAVCVTTNTVQTATLRMGEVNTEVYLNDADTGTTRKVSEEPVERLPGIYSSLLSVSPDGKKLAYITGQDEALNDAVLWVVTLSSSAKQRIAGIPAGFWPTHPIWSQDGSTLGYVVRNGAQLDFNTVGIQDKKTTTIPISLMKADNFYGDPGVAGPICFSTDNTRVVLSTPGASTQLEVSLADQTSKTVSKPLQAASSQDKSFAVDPATLSVPPLAPLPDSACGVATFSQNDPSWRDLVMKSRADTQSDTIGASGCALTSAAMMLNYFKVSTDPNELNQCMGADSNPINWNLPATQCSDGVVVQGRRDYFSWDSLNTSLSQGQPAVVGLLGGQTGTHFVVVLGGYDSIASTYRVNDPWDGTNNKSLAYYVSRGYQLQWLVTFQGANPPVCKPRVAAISDTNPNFVLKQSSPEDGRAYNQPVNVVVTGASDKATLTLNQFATATVTNTTATGITTTTTPTPVAEQTGNQPNQSGNSQVIANGQQISGEGAYQLVVDSPADNGSNQRLTTNFVIDQTPPTLTRIPVGAFESNLSATGAQIAHGNVTLQLKATDNLSGIAIIEYTVNGGAVQPYTNDVSPKPVIFTDAGDYDVIYRATDGAGNVSQQQEWKFQIVLNNTDIGPNGANTATPTATVAATTPPVTDNAGGGENNGGGATTAAPTTAPGGGGSGGGGTTAPPGTTPPIIVAGSLVAAPNQIAFDATMDGTIVPINLTNAGAAPINFTIQAPAGAAGAYLKFSSLTGTVPATGALPFQVQLASLNYTGQPIQGAFNIVYSGNSLQVPFTVAPQPNPTVAFTSPAAGPISGTVTIKLAVTTTGAGKPNHINLSSKYLDKFGGTVEERALAGQATASNGWTFNWDVSALPPQTGIEIYASVCWSSDDSNCFKVDPGLTGLIIPNPSAVVTLDPNNASLAGTVTINAAVAGPLDHITYSYAYQKDGANVGPITITTKANASNQYKVAWDTSSIPPQGASSQVTLKALVCPTGDETKGCVDATSITPAKLTVDQPLITILPLADADAKSLPLKVSLGGSVNKLYNPGATVWVEYQPKLVSGSLGAVVEVPATINSLTNGTAVWSASVDTTNLMPNQSVSFVPKVCWDGKNNGNYCFSAAAGVVGTIPDLAPAFVSPAPSSIFSTTTNLVLTTTLPVRASSIKLLLTYNKFNGTAVADSQLAVDANPGNNFTVSFDSVALGLAPGPISIKLIACSVSTYCTPATAAVPFVLPVSTLTLTPTQDQLVAAPLPDKVSLPGSVAGRNVGNLKLFAIYNDSRQQTVPYSTTLNIGPVAAGQSTTTSPFPVTWDTTNIPPQTGTIGFSYQMCWSGSLDSGCTALSPYYINLSRAAPNVSSVSINNGATYNPNGNLTLPIPYDKTTYLTTTILLPITAIVTDTKVTKIKWQLQGISGQGNSAYVSDLVTTTVFNNSAVSKVPLQLGNLITRTNQSPAGSVVADFNLVAIPIWNDSVVITDATKFKIEPIKFVNFNVLMRGSDTSIPIDPSGSQSLSADSYKTATTMISSTTLINLSNFKDNGGSDATPIVKKAYYSVSYNIGTTTAQTNVGISTGGANPTRRVGLTTNSFQIGWNHLTDTPAITPQSGIILNWQICNTDTDDSGCLPITIENAFTHVDTLTLANINFAPDPTTVGNNVNQGISILKNNDRYFNSAFDGYTKVVGGSAIKAVRYIAYPDTGTPNLNNAVVLSTHAVITNTSNIWQSSVYFPPPNNDQVTTIQGTEMTQFMKAVGNNHLNMVLAVQMCSKTTPDITNPADPSCSDWTGVTSKVLDTTGVGLAKGKLGIVLVWRPMLPCVSIVNNKCLNNDSPKDPYDQAVQDGTNTPTEDNRVLQLDIYVVPNANNVNTYDDSNSRNNVNTYYTTAITTTGVMTYTFITDTVSPISTGQSSQISGSTVGRSWYVRTLNLPADTNGRSVNLVAEVIFKTTDESQNAASDPTLVHAGSFTAIATVPTKGNVNNYNTNPPVVIGVAPTIEPSPTPTTPADTPIPTSPTGTEPNQVGNPTSTAPPATAPPTIVAPTSTAPPPTTAPPSPTQVPPTEAPPTTVALPNGTPTGMGNGPSSS